MPNSEVFAGALLAGVLAAIQTPALAAPQREAAAAPSAAPIPLNGAHLGMTLEEWRRLPWAGPASDHVASDCVAASPLLGRAQGGLHRASRARAVLDCRYAARYGAYSLPESFPLSSRYLVREPQFEFIGGRLAEVRFHTSIDAFDLLSARLDGAYGQPVRMVRDTARFGGGETLPRVRATWRIPAGSIVLTDPSSNPQEIEIRLDASLHPPAQAG